MDIPPGYQQIKCHLIFDIKMGENFRRKARFVAGGHTTDVPDSIITYSSVVSRDSVRIALTIAGLNGLQVMACDIQNAYLTADCREKNWTVAGPEFGSEAGTIFVVRKALYGLKSAGAAFRSLLADTLMDIGYKPTKADPDVWLRPAVKANGFEYYELVLCYVDDILSISDNPKATLLDLTAVFKLKNDKIEPPEMYLGAQLDKMIIDGAECWTMSAEKICDGFRQECRRGSRKKGTSPPFKVLHSIAIRLPT
jgi:Reverse transcriptase (RNA-dependent DNA polymerase)